MTEQVRNQCPCGSLLDFSTCHAAIESEEFVPQAPEWFEFTSPVAWTDDAAEVVARRYTDLGAYQVNVVGRSRWAFQLASPITFLRHYPILRSTQDGDTQFFAKPLENCSTWADLREVIPEERRDQARHDLETTTAFRQPSDIDDFQQNLAAIIAAPTRSQFEPAMRFAAEQLTRNFPTSSIDLVWKDKACLWNASLIQMLAKQQFMSVDAIHDGLFAQRGPFGVWALTLDPGPFFAVLRQLSYPSITGFDLFGEEFGIIVDYGANLDFPPLSELEARIRGVQGWMYSGHRDSKITTMTTGIGTRYKLRAWLTRRLNNLFAQVGYLGTFAKDGQIDPLSQWKALLTLREIAALTELIITTSNEVAVKLLFFDVMDRYSGLSGKGITDLLSERFVTKKLAASIDEGLGEVQKPIQQLIHDAWTELVDELWDGLYSKSARQAGEIALGDGRTYTPKTFAPRIMKALRNSLHAYGLRESAEFEEILGFHHGTVPSTVRAIAVGFWFALMCDPRVFFGRYRLDLMSSTHKYQ